MCGRSSVDSPPARHTTLAVAAINQAHRAMPGLAESRASGSAKVHVPSNYTSSGMSRQCANQSAWPDVGCIGIPLVAKRSIESFLCLAVAAACRQRHGESTSVQAGNLAERRACSVRFNTYDSPDSTLTDAPESCTSQVPGTPPKSVEGPLVSPAKQAQVADYRTQDPSCEHPQCSGPRLHQDPLWARLSRRFSSTRR
ncbi:hypothetical protein VFPFJ_09536 [Purpureocillium lilacinum]|uniref:Uncharacterized protein n=1 Tax=Purpureocillium lilacinum TaxID=33203 RepID=A0A179GUZ2_PURLI|nr:hypothetical protein VFPFJ_09536 [Purpureocillium lilacinum]OAQ75455.1 hypothetical protein VFPBJ_09428 [Purpureocillium lilacinum]OAQ81081.1 hypothetical protein VFPFJ_09536 [Purpureocillium lilacinum]